MPTAEEILQTSDEVISLGVNRGVLHVVAQDTRLDGRMITVDGRRLANFGSCSYLGLETHPAMRRAVIDGVEKYGTQFSSSRAFISAPDYPAAEEALSQIFGRPTILTPTTTLGHIATIPSVVGERDAFVLDHQVHSSVQVAAKLARTQGTLVELVRHSNIDMLEDRIKELRSTHNRIWYACDGLYSIYADFAPIDALNELAERYEQLFFYIDDSHAVSCMGKNGRGYALEHLSSLAAQRAIVSAGLAKSFAVGGCGMTFPDQEMCRRVFTVGGPMVFSGPLQPPMLAAVLASARLHLTPEVAARQRRLLELIRLFNTEATRRDLPLVSNSDAPIRYIGAGIPEAAFNLADRVKKRGFFAGTATFPAVATKRSGLRLTITCHQTDDDIRGMVTALEDCLPYALADEGGSAAILNRVFARQLAGRVVRVADVRAPATAESGLRLEYFPSITGVDKAEWDAIFADRGLFSWDGLHTMEAVFMRPDNLPEHQWTFHYWTVRDRYRRIMLATFFVTALWKEDFLSPEEVSREIERRRLADPYYLTSTRLAMGTTLSGGECVFLERSGPWRAALRLLLGAVREEDDRQDTAAIMLRDLPDGDDELRDFLIGEGFVRIPMLEDWVAEGDFSDRERFMATLSANARSHLRRNVLKWESQYRIEALEGGSEAAVSLDRDLRHHLHRLYLNIHDRHFDINGFALPEELLESVLANPRWVFIVLHLVDGPDEPVGFAVCHRGNTSLHFVYLGMDYEYVVSHHVYPQILYQVVKTAGRHGLGRIHFGSTTGYSKSRFGAKPVRSWIYIQPTKTYESDVVTQLTETLHRNLAQA